MADPSSPPPPPPPYSVQQPPYSPGPAAYEYKPSPTPPGPYPSRLPASGAWLAPDPRSSSTQSLLPVYPSETSLQKTPLQTSAGDNQGRRKLLVIYLHGFLGNDQSFRSFPAHVHALLTNLLVDSHVIHSKIYPRYKTYRAVDVARDNFSEWLAPHESPTTDVVLVGHSMGGILAADVILMPNPSPYGTYPFKHRILGHISMDCPFLGLHPGIVVSGISSLFKPAATPQDHSQENANAPYGASEATSPSSSSLNLTTSHSSIPGSPSSAASASYSQLPHDPFFNQPFFNDSALQERPFVRRMLHFASKYRSEGLVQAAAKHVVSYLEFGSCLADLSGLESRYAHLRALEDVDELQTQNQSRDPRAPTTRVRFVNYYTLCTGRPKTPKSETPKAGTPDEFASSQQSGFSTPNTTADTALGPGSSFLQPNATEDHLRASQESPRPSITIEHRDTMGNATNHQTLLDANHKDSPAHANTTQNDTEAITSDINRLSMHDIDPTPIDESTAPSDQPRPTEEVELAPLPDPPTPPELPDLTIYTDKDERKQAEKEAKRLQRAYDHAVKDHAKSVREREKLLEKRRRRAQKEADKALKEAARQEKEALKEAEREARDEQRRVEKEAAEQQARDWEDHGRAAEAEVIAEARELDSSRPKKLRKFCNVPRDGRKVTDPTWVDVFMADVDEVGAHCGLFFPGQHYEQLVGDVGSRIMGWVQEDLTKRAILEMGA
ncbi:hypothetical protein N0V84_010785 [Fusarium piperis]|uniref:DUF676 domain-containing protein n=1 Tax=Fusarium piperis TaxID=1435070 RepID=A0A9W8W4J6_9HYPO|nr:hypothetical protein N0V84_010785 [Fusarium piperis]